MEEGQLELAESVVRRDEGDLPDHGRAVVCSQHLSKPSFTFGRRRLHEASVLEPQRHAGHVGAKVGKGTRHRDEAMCPPEIWCRLDFFCWHVRQVRLAPSRLPLDAPPARVWKKADQKIGSGATKAERVVGTRIEHLGARRELAEVVSPCCNGIRLVEPRRTSDHFAQTPYIRLAEDSRRPSLRGERNDCPRKPPALP